MKLKVAVAIILTAWTAGVLQSARAEQAAPAAQTAPGAQTTWSGVFTDEQAKTGEANYTKTCTECHGEDLAGDGFAPALKGPEFLNNWNGLTVGDLFERIRVSMPPSDPNVVGAKEKAEIVAFLLKSNGFPAGTAELTPNTEALKGIKLEATKPGQ